MICKFITVLAAILTDRVVIRKTVFIIDNFQIRFGSSLFSTNSWISPAIRYHRWPGRIDKVLGARAENCTDGNLIG